MPEFADSPDCSKRTTPFAAFTQHILSHHSTSATNQIANMMQSSVASTQICHPSSHVDKQRKPFSVAGCRQPVTCQAQQSENINVGRRTMAAVLSAMPMALVVQKGSVGHNLINTLLAASSILSTLCCICSQCAYPRKRRRGRGAREQGQGQQTEKNRGGKGH